uniref:Uncharacterized protein n=1 Tax=uncultured marine virus TaxID=186617 RepID=A0A0F7L4M5_9VIRU|nr:hypothetical protein [uncultured marine virus]
MFFEEFYLISFSFYSHPWVCHEYASDSEDYRILLLNIFSRNFLLNTALSFS